MCPDKWEKEVQMEWNEIISKKNTDVNEVVIQG